MKQTPLNRSDSDNQRKGKRSYCSNETKQNKNKKKKKLFQKRNLSSIQNYIEEKF